jgi:micrococcal nuclease
MGRLGRTALVVGALLLSACDAGTDDDTDAGGRGAPAAGPTTTAEQLVGEIGAQDELVVESITDGDTFRTTDGQRVRFIGIDTPEVDQDQCFADEATAALEALIPPGSTVRLELDVDPVDRFGRTLAYVHRGEDDLDVGLQLATDGYALQLTVPPNVAREAAIAAAVAAARDAGRGLWGPACAEPQAIAPVTEPPTTPAPPPPTEPPTTATPPPIQPVAGGCHPSYPDLCIPPAPPDLDCGDVGAQRFTVVAPDPHGFDGDHDGIGCEG